MEAMSRATFLVVLFTTLLASCWAPVDSAKILGVFGHIGKSHFDAFEPLMRELARRGHQVLVISHFPQAKRLANYTDISLKGSITDFTPTGQISVAEMKINNIWDVKVQQDMLADLAIKGCESTFNHTEVQKLLRSNQKFDLLITELFTTDCYLAFAHRYKIPHIVMSSCLLMPWSHERFGNPQNPAYLPDLFHQHSMRMTFWERVQNTLKTIIDLQIYEFLFHRPTEEIARKYFKDLPRLDDITQNVSLMLVNSHFSFTHSRPQVPAIVEIAGIHLAQHKPLPKDIKDFLDGGKDGVVYFNMGSMIRATSLQPEKRQAFLQAFARLGNRVLWKWEEENMPGLPPNVKTSKWIPQYDVLSHPNVRVYIGHGGMLGSIEAADSGVPMLAIPIFGDQRVNAKNLVMAGFALELDYNDATADTVLAALKELLENPKYREAAQRVKTTFRDRPQSPMDTAVYWTEYVIRYGGAPHLRSPAAGMPWYQRWLLDVGAFLFAIVALVIVAIKTLLARLFASTRTAGKLKGE